MMEKILIIDDDTNLLASLQRHFYERFDLSTAQSGEQALALVESHGPFAVAVCDMRMPGMDGVETLGALRKIAPDTVRMMLTGNADQKTAIDAVNEGNIFRFLAKPCSLEILAKGIVAGLEQYRLITAEQELLEQTLSGSVKVLVDVLSMNDPVGFGRSNKIHGWASIVAQHLKLKQSWRLSMAAMLSQLGNILIPPEVLIKMSKGAELSEIEQEIVDGTPGSTRDLIANIPRLKPVSKVVYLQNKGFDGSGPPKDGPRGTDIPLEARILKILVDLETQTHGAYSTQEAFKSLSERGDEYDTKLLSDIRQCLEGRESNDKNQKTEEVELPVSLLFPGYILQSDLKLENNRLILSAGNRLSTVHVKKIRAFSKMHKFKEPVKVIRRRSSAGPLRTNK